MISFRMEEQMLTNRSMASEYRGPATLAHVARKLTHPCLVPASVPSTHLELTSLSSVVEAYDVGVDRAQLSYIALS